MTVHAAERGNPGGAGSTKNLASTHRASTERSRSGKASSNRSARSTKARTHKSDRPSRENRRIHDSKRTASNRDGTRPVNDNIQPDANIQVELPRREDEKEHDTEADDVDQNNILIGEGTDDRDH